WSSDVCSSDLNTLHIDHVIEPSKFSMSILKANNISKFYGADEIFSNVSVEITNDARTAMVGPNGAGKTTMIKLFIGDELPTEGSIHIAKGAKLAYLPQRPELVGNHTLWEEAISAF